MQKSVIHVPQLGSYAANDDDYNDFVIKFANVNGSGSASANGMFAKAVFRMGIPVAHAQHFPVEHSGIADVVRGSRQRRRLPRPPRRRRHHGGDECRRVCGGHREPGAGRLSPLRQHQAAAPVNSDARTTSIDIGIPLSKLLLSEFDDPQAAPAVQEHHLRRRAGRAAQHRLRRAHRHGVGAVQRQGRADPAEHPCARNRPRLRARLPRPSAAVPGATRAIWLASGS